MPHVGEPYPVATPGSGARSSEVRVRYFDPATGEPLDRPKAVSAKGRRAEKDKVRRVPVLVDGEVLPSIRDAAACSVSYHHLQRSLKQGRSEVNGHSVAYVEGEK